MKGGEGGERVTEGRYSRELEKMAVVNCTHIRT